MEASVGEINVHDDVHEKDEVHVEERNESGNDDVDESLIDVQWSINEDSDMDDELCVAREKVKEYVQKNRVCIHNKVDAEVNDPDQGIRAIVQTYNSQLVTKNVVQNESDYMDSLYLGSYIDIDGSEDDEAQKVKSSNKNYNPKVPFTDFVLGLRLNDLKMFKMALTQFSTKERFEFKYKKNDKVRVRAICSTNGCNWSILCS